jgi:hypothetical protein
MARPRKEIDQKEFEKLCAMQCTEQEICNWFDNISEDTLNRWCKRTYKDENGKGLSFAEVFSQKRGYGKTSIRRAQWQLGVEKLNPTMLIWLGRNYLGQAETVSTLSRENDDQDDPITKSLKEDIEHGLI